MADKNKQPAAETPNDPIVALKSAFRKFCKEPLNGEEVVKLMTEYRGKFREIKIAELNKKFS